MRRLPPISRLTAAALFVSLGALILSPALIVSPAGTRTAFADLFIRGDATLDRDIDISDAVSTLGCLFLGQACTSCADASDANDDGQLDLSDPVYTLTFSFLGGAPPRPPYPEPGPDPTDDALACDVGLEAELSGLEVAPPALDLDVAGEVQLAVTGVYSDGTRADRTSSSHGTTYRTVDTAIATVTSEGLVHALREGETLVIVELSGRQAEVRCTVRSASGLPPIVISEIMYHPASDDDRDEYIEIHHRGTGTTNPGAINLAGYHFTEGVRFTFPDVVLEPRSYLVVAKDSARLKSLYGIQNVVGDYELQLDDGGEMVRLKDPADKTVDEVRYDDGGLWPRGADGWGSSLELIDLHGENDTPAAWAASDEAAESAWEPFTCTQTATGGSNELHLLLLHQGECLLDNLQVMVGGSNRLANGSFEDGMQGWLAQGTHRLSGVTDDDAVDGGSSLHLVATGRGDTAANRIERDLTSSAGGGQQVTIRGSARWLRGSRHLLTRLQGNTVACTTQLKLPQRPGTPGAANSTAVQNRGPDVELVTHLPVLPTGAQKVTVTALVRDADGVQAVELRYRVNDGAETKLAMVDDGTGGDLDAGDGVYTVQLPARGNGSMVAFWISATDGSATATFPDDAPARTCLYRTGEPNPASQLDRYHVWMPRATVDLLRSGTKMSNELLDITFVLNNSEVFYNAKIRYRGSPFIRGAPPTDPVNGRYAYRIDFGEHQPLKGTTEINLDNLEVGRDPTLQRERTAHLLYRELGLPNSTQEYVRLWINGSDHQVYEDVQKIDQDYVNEQWPDDAEGYLHKIDDYFEFDDAGGFSNRDASLNNFGAKKEEYRWNWEKRSHDRNDEFGHMYNLVAKMNAADASYEASVESAIDAEEWARVLAVRKIIGDWDSFGYNRGKNMYAYYPAISKRWQLAPWDMDFLLGNGDGPFTSLFGGIDGAVNRFLNHPKYRRMYLRAFRDLIDGPFRNEFLDPVLDADYNILRRETSVSPPTSIKDFIRMRRAFVLSQIPGPDLVITTNGGDDFSTSAASVTIAGQAPLEVETFRLNGAAFSPTKIGLAGWTFTRAIPLGETTFLVEGFDDQNVLVSSDSIKVLRVPPCVPSAIDPPSAPAGSSLTLTVTGAGFVAGSQPLVRLTSSSAETGFSALYVQANGSFGGGGEALDNAISLLDNPSSAVRSLSTKHVVLSLRSGGGGEIFPNPQRFPAPWNGDPSNFAARYTGFINVPSPGTRTFGVHSDDGFRLTIGGSQVAEWPQPRAPATSLGDFDFPAAGSYPLTIEWYENGGDDVVQFFQQDQSGNRALLNSGSELSVTLEDLKTIPASSVTVESETTIRVSVDLTGAEPGKWNLLISPQQGSDCVLKAAFTVK